MNIQGAINISRDHKINLALSAQLLLLLLIFIISLCSGAVEISPKEVVYILANKTGLTNSYFTTQQETVLLYIRLPRLLIAIMIGGALGISGASLQGLFRNPLVEPGLLGISSGAALMAVLVIVFSATLPAYLSVFFGTYMVPVFSFLGSLTVTVIVYRFSQREGRTHIAILILAGIAITAFAQALIGLAIYYADDMALRNFTFWSLGDLGGASWNKIAVAAPFIMLPVAILLRLHHQLNALAVGDSEAWHMGVHVEKIKYIIIVCSALAIGASVALAGMIGFIGLVVPHILRTALGPDHAFVLPGSLISGAILLILADLFARTVVTPSEIPIGIITALLGSPFFIWLIVNAKRKNLI